MISKIVAGNRNVVGKGSRVYERKHADSSDGGFEVTKDMPHGIRTIRTDVRHLRTRVGRRAKMKRCGWGASAASERFNHGDYQAA